MTVILDTNVLLVSIGKQSKYRKIFDAINNQEINIIVSNEILSEYEEIISRKTSNSIAINILEMLTSFPNVYKRESFYKWNLLVDKDENKFVDLFISSNAEYIVTNDKHFNILETIKFPKVKILNIDTFLKLI